MARIKSIKINATMRDIDYDRETPNDLLTLQSIELKAVADVEFLTQLMRFVDQYLPEQEKVNLDIIPSCNTNTPPSQAK